MRPLRQCVHRRGRHRPGRRLGRLAGQPVTQTLNPPAPSYYTCMAVGEGTIV